MPSQGHSLGPRELGYTGKGHMDPLMAAGALTQTPASCFRVPVCSDRVGTDRHAMEGGKEGGSERFVTHTERESALSLKE